MTGLNPVKIHGFDPLTETIDLPGADQAIFQEATKRVVQNILKSYTSYFDVFSEMFQNALDAIDLKASSNPVGWTPCIWIEVNIQDRIIRVTDNGIGMSLEQFLYCFRPNVSFKNRRQSRGHKGVGATFLAYGYSLVTLKTKKGNESYAARMRNGRQWADDSAGHYERPRLESMSFSSAELESSDSGTSIEVVIGEGQRPNLPWLNASSAQQWLQVFRARTPLGGIYLSSPEKATKTEVKLRVVDAAGEASEITLANPQYNYPHEIPFLQRVKSIREIQRALSSIKGDPQEQMRKVPENFKRLDASWEVWDKSELLEDESPFARELDLAGREIIERHNVIVYACFVSTAKTWNKWRDEIVRINKVADVMKGGLIIASDHMVQGERMVIPLTSAIGYQANISLYTLQMAIRTWAARPFNRN